MKLKAIITTCLALLMVVQVHSQNRVLSGKITDPNGEELTGASIYVENMQNRSLTGTIADINGNYKLVLPDDQDLVIICSFIGYEAQRVNYNGQTILNFELKELVTSLDFVEIIAEREPVNDVGITYREQVSSTQKIDVKELQSIPLTSIEAGLQGRMANVDIISGTDPGSRSSIRIRGTSSLNASSEPLIVIDGVPYPVPIDDDFNFATANDQDLGALVNISPNDIESIEVLRDAAATLIWGSPGANGVLIFKTKKGTRGKTRFSFSSKLDIKKEPNTIPLLDGAQYVSLMQDAVWNSINDVGYDQGLSYSNILSESFEINFVPDWVYFDEYNQNTNWMNEITQTGFYSDNSFSMSGGGEKATYRVSLGYLSDIGTTIGTSFDRFSSFINVNYRFSDKVQVNSDLSFAHSDRKSSWTDGSSTFRKLKSPRGEALIRMPNMSPYFIDENGEQTDQYFTPLQNFQGGFVGGDDLRYNPVAMVNESENNTKAQNARAVFRLTYNILENLQYTSTLGIDIRSNKNKKFLPQSVTGVLWTSPYFNLSSDLLSDELYLNTENKLIYNVSVAEKHDFLVSAIVQTNEAQNFNYSSQTSGNASQSLADPTSGAAVNDLGSGKSVTRRVGLNAYFHYGFLNRYIIDAGYRMEANSRLGADSRWAGFPTLGASWLFSEEAFIQRTWLNLGKLRFSWGQSGNPPSSGAQPYVGIFKPITPGYIDLDAISPSTIQLDNLKMETITQTNIGGDFYMFDNKLSLTVDLYSKITTDLLQKDVKLPTSTGFAEVRYFNSGKVSNKGWEVTTNYELVRKDDVGVTLSLNLSQNINEVLELPDNLQFESYKFDNGEYAHRIVEGNPIGSFYGYRYLGVYQNGEETLAKDDGGNQIYDINGLPVYIQNGNRRVFPGDARYEDINGDGVIDQFDIVYLGNAMPIMVGGGGVNVRYKNWLLTTWVYGRYGQEVVNSTRVSTESMRGESNQSTAVLSRWRRPGDDTMMPRALYGEGYNTLGSDRFVEDASFLRLRTLSLRYTLPNKWLHSLKISRMQIWVTGTDLFTWTKYSGQDPEVPLSSDIFLLSEDNASTPKPRRYSIGLNLDF